MAINNKMRPKRTGRPPKFEVPMDHVIYVRCDRELWEALEQARNRYAEKHPYERIGKADIIRAILRATFQ